MTTGNKYGKLPLDSISYFKLLFLPVLFLCLSISLSAGSKEKRWTVVIDAGHGGRDPGAVGATSFEKNITLAIALKTGQYIEENLTNINVIYTRKTDIFIDIRERAEIANRNNADLFISIHANWGKLKSIEGTETFIMGLAKDEQNLAVAMKENEVILLENDYSAKYEGFDPKSPESYIMFTLMQNVFQEQSTILASKIQAQYKQRLSRVDRGVKQAGFWVLFMTTMPSVLTEIGFITNPTEEKYLNSKQGQDYLSSALYRACRDYFSEIESKSIVLTENNRYVAQDLSASKGANTSKTGQPPPNTSQPSSKSEQPVVKKETNKINSATPADEELIFSVQLSVSAAKIPLNASNFKGLKEINESRIHDSYIYTSGSFPDYSSALRHRKKVETIYPDAFVIAFKGNKILPLQQAIELLKK